MRTACKAFHTRGSEQAGCSLQFQAYLCSKGINRLPLAAFRGNCLNVLFHDSAGIYFLRRHLLDYLSVAHGQLNLLLQSVSSDLKVPQYIAGCRALGIIDKVVTGPLWRHLQLSTMSVLGMSDVYTYLDVKRFERWGQDAQPLIECKEYLLHDDQKKMKFRRLCLLAQSVRPSCKRYCRFFSNLLFSLYSDYCLIICLVVFIIQLLIQLLLKKLNVFLQLI